MSALTIKKSALTLSALTLVDAGEVFSLAKGMNRGGFLTSKQLATLDDVASLAGVSAKTVSRVVNRDAHVSDATRKRVEAAIQTTGYQFNRAARSLASARSYLIGTFIPNAPSFYHSEFFRGAIKGCRRHDYHLVIEEYDFEAKSILDRYERGLRGAGCEALLLTPPVCDDEALLDSLDRDGVQYVRIAPVKQIDRSIALFPDDYSGMEQLTRHVWECGARTFGMIAGPSYHASATIRETAFLQTLEKLGADPRQTIINRPLWQEPTAEVAYMSARSLLTRSGGSPDAILGFNDEAAIGAIACARDLGLSVPQDVMVTGFDDSYAARLTWPELTTVHQPIAEIAMKAVEIISEGNTSTEGCIYLPTNIVIRNST